MATLNLLDFINTHPSPTVNENVNFWITTGSQGEFFLNGVTIPLQSQESELATIISQADKVYFELPSFDLLRYEFSNDTTNSTVAGLTGFSRFSFNSSSISNVNQIYINSFGNLNSTDYSGSLSKWTSLISSSITFYSSNKTVTFNVTGSSFSGGMSSFFTLHVKDGQGTLFNNGEQASIRLQAGPLDIEEDYSKQVYTYGIQVDTSKKVVSKKVVSGSLFHNYILFKKPERIRYYELQNTTLQTHNFFFEPSFNQLFAYSDYEVLGNDIQEIRKSKRFLKVDRDSSQSNPTNLSVILTSSLSLEAQERELFAEVQDSYYDSISWNRSRYEGSSYVSRTILPAAHYAVPLDAYIFDIAVSSSALLNDIRNAVQQLPPISPILYFTPIVVGNSTLENELIVSQSAGPTDFENTITVTRVNKITKQPANVVSNGIVEITFAISNDVGDSYNIQEDLIIPSGNSSGSLSFVNFEPILSDDRGTFLFLSKTFSKIESTDIPDTDIVFTSPVKTTPDSRVRGLTVFLEQKKGNTDFLPLLSKKIYDPKTKILYETDSRGLLISTLS
jgi:hypothetical protein